MTSAAPLDAIRRAAVVLRRQPDADVVASGDALSAWLSGSKPTLDAAMGLKPQVGQLRPATQAAIEQRNMHLREAADQFALDARGLAVELHRYASSSWLRERSLPECPARLTARLQWHLWHALRAWPRPIRERQLATVLQLTCPIHCMERQPSSGRS